MQQWFLPGGLVLAIALALVAPEPGSAVNRTGLVSWLVATIFLVNGYQTRIDARRLGRRFLRVLAAGAGIGLLLSPWLGVATAALLGLPAAAALGLVVMASMPPTLSSGVILTGNAGGDVLWAMLLTILLNLAGIVSVPFVLDLALEAGAEVAISPWPLLWRLLTLVLVPFVAGVGLRRLFESRPPGWVRYVPSTCIIITVWMAMSASSGTLLELTAGALGLIVAGALLVHGALLGLCAAAGRALELAPAERIAVLFVVSQKTLPVALGVLTALEAPIAGALVVCIVFHFLQLMVDAVLAARLRPPARLRSG
ncbi:MAG: bile acid:sodium symporter [Gammaproteobacteria bacterium]|nr:bile acid:sodium symporter [Gammaproteobacteria bacterium]